ncbi:MAG: DUF1080 domain-containing protein [Verrucomicrobia bacterium]|nr:DUF1080 domain-containing protein [Verrucomicrobiota bacterium]
MVWILPSLALPSMMAWLTLSLAAAAAERKFDFGQTKIGETPKGFRSTVSGEGKPGDWKVILDDAPSAMHALPNEAPLPAKQSVLAQLARDPTDEHFPLLIFDEESFGDFTFTVRLKTVSGQVEQMAGVAFRIQDERNYYVVRVSSLANNIRFYKFANGIRSPAIGPDMPIPKGVWHELTVECKGNEITLLLNGRPAMPALTDTSFAAGKIGFWTKSDAISHFTQARITYTPRERLAESLVKDVLKEWSKLRSLKVYAMPAGTSEPRVIASGKASDLGEPGGKQEKQCLEQGTVFYGKDKDTVTVMMALHDRNGEIVAAVKVTMNTFFGQTDQNAAARARPIIKFMERRILGSLDKLE